MNKEQVIETIKTSVEQKIITKEEVIAVVNKTSESSVSSLSVTSSKSESMLPKVLYTIGGIIAVTGILVLLGNNWDSIGFIGRWLVTVGLGLCTFVGAIIVYKKQEYSVLTQVLFAISATASFIGGFVWIGESSASMWSASSIWLLVSSILLVVYATALYVTQKTVLHIVSTIFFTCAYYALVIKLLGDSMFDMYIVKDIMVYTSMILAIGYFMYGSWIETGTFSKKTLTTRMQELLSRLYTFVAFALFLFSGLFLGGVWNLIYAFIVIGAVTLSVKLKTKLGLMVTSVAIGIYCIKISVTYFSDSISFSFALLLSGLLIIALGYLTYYLNKKYITEKSN